MEIRVLRYFLTVAREGSITGAANYLHLTQPTLSRQLMDLEKELGQKLFIRGNHTLTLTPEGMILRKRAEEILDMVEKTQKEFLSIKNEISGEVYIGSGETEIMKYIAEVIQEIRNEYPEIIFHMQSGNLEDVTEKLDKGLLDFGIIMQPSDITKYNRISLPYKDIWGIVMQKESPLAKKEFIELSDLENVPLILSRKAFRKPTPDNEFYRWFEEKKDKLNIAATYNLFFNAAILAQQGVGYMFTLNNLTNSSKSSTLCFRPLKPTHTAGWDIVWKKYQVFSPAAKLFLEKLQEKFGT